MLHDVPPLSACRGAGCRREARLVPRDMGRVRQFQREEEEEVAPRRTQAASPPPTSRRTIEERIAKQSVFEEPIAFGNQRPGLGVGTAIASRGGRSIMPFPTSVSRGAFVGCRAVPLMLGERSAADALRHTHTRRPRMLVGPGLPFSYSPMRRRLHRRRGECVVRDRMPPQVMPPHVCLRGAL